MLGYAGAVIFTGRNPGGHAASTPYRRQVRLSARGYRGANLPRVVLVFIVALSLQMLHALGTGEEHVIGYAEEESMFHDSRNDIEQIRQGFHIGNRTECAIGDHMTAIGAVDLA